MQVTLCTHVVTGKGAYGSVTEELVVQNLLLCGLVLYSVKVIIPQQGDTTKHKMTVVADLTSYGTKLPPPPPYLVQAREQVHDRGTTCRARVRD